MKTNITIEKESYWKLREIKARLRCTTWDEMVNKIYNMVFADEKRNQS